MQVGFKALADRYGIALAQPLRVESVIGTTRVSRESNEFVTNKYPASYQPTDDFAGHFEFGLKYEDIHLEFFARLFAVTGQSRSKPGVGEPLSANMPAAPDFSMSG